MPGLAACFPATAWARFGGFAFSKVHGGRLGRIAGVGTAVLFQRFDSLGLRFYLFRLIFYLPRLRAQRWPQCVNERLRLLERLPLRCRL